VSFNGVGRLEDADETIARLERLLGGDALADQRAEQALEEERRLRQEERRLREEERRLHNEADRALAEALAEIERLEQR
jgi:hypothetical protein